MQATPLRFRLSTTSAPLEIAPTRLIVAGYTGRDEEAVAAHIAELADIGVPPPPTVPAFYDLDPVLLTTEPVVTVEGAETSGEVEPVIIRHGSRHYLGIGSDHTDRDKEKTDISSAKAVCPKPLGEVVLPLPDDLSAFDWDAVVAVSEVDGEPYQRGTLAGLRPPADLLDRLAAAVPDTDGDVFVFGGTFPLLTGHFVYGGRWRLEFRLGDGTTLTHTYETTGRSSA
jgi:4-hydroxyphenylacetate 3-monooxygenase